MVDVTARRALDRRVRAGLAAAIGTRRVWSRGAAAGRWSVGWHAPGDDWGCGRAKRYRVITSNCPIKSPTDGRLIADVGAQDRVGDVRRAGARRGAGCAAAWA